MTRRNQFRCELALAVALGAIGVFVVPWFWWRQGVPNISFSYTYGFNNITGSLAAALFLVSIFMVQWRARCTVGPSQAELALKELLEGDRSRDRSRVGRAAVIGVMLYAIGTVVAWYLVIPKAWFGELAYFFPRLELMVRGERPYVDFSFMYGPAMLYPPYWLCRLSHGLISLEDAYCTTLTAYWILGVGLSAYVINCLGAVTSKTLAFLCLMPPALLAVLALGLQYTPLRFVCAPASLFFIHRMITGNSAPSGLAPGWTPGTTLAAFFLPLASFSLSPEMGFVTCAALMAYFLVLAYHRRITALGHALAALIAFPAAWFWFGADYFHGLLSSGDGSINFPIFPGPPVLLVLGAAAWILPLLGVIACSGHDKLQPAAPLAAAMLTLSGLMLPAALGRCDGGHIFYNEFLLFILFLFLAAALRGRTLRLSLITLIVVVFGCCGAFSLWSESRLTVLNAIRFRLGRAPLGSAEEERRPVFQKAVFDLRFAGAVAGRLLTGQIPLHRDAQPPPFDCGPADSSASILAGGKAIPFGPDLPELLVYDKIGTPLGSTEEIDRFLKISGRQIREFYLELPMSAPGLARKLRDLSAMEIIMVPERALVPPSPAAPPTDLQRQKVAEFLSSLLLFPVSLPPADHPAFFPEPTVIEHILTQFVVIGRFRDFAILRRKTP